MLGQILDENLMAGVKEQLAETGTCSQKGGHDGETKQQLSTVATFTVPLDTEVFKE